MSDPMDAIKAVDEAHAKATEGVWAAGPWAPGSVFAPKRSRWLMGDGVPADCDFTIAAHNNWPAIRAHIAALTAERDAARSHTSNLLARIHGDGGHYESQHGTTKAVEDADAIVVALQAERDALRAIVRRTLTFQP